jgi:hypothetical protein
MHYSQKLHVYNENDIKIYYLQYNVVIKKPKKKILSINVLDP